MTKLKLVAPKTGGTAVGTTEFNSDFDAVPPVLASGAVDATTIGLIVRPAGGAKPEIGFNTSVLLVLMSKLSGPNAGGRICSGFSVSFTGLGNSFGVTLVTSGAGKMFLI